MQEKNVSIVDMIEKEDMFPNLFMHIKLHLFDLLEENHVKLICGSSIRKFTNEGVEVMDHNWHTQTLKADDVVIALGMKANNTLFDEVSKVVLDTYLVGDSNEVGDIYSANHSAFNIAVEL